MKKICAVLLVFVLTFTLFGCIRIPKIRLPISDTARSEESTAVTSYETETEYVTYPVTTGIVETETEIETETTETIITTSEETSIVEEPKNSTVPLPAVLNFIFTSGAGGWWTEVELLEDGSFHGEYIDGELGDTGEGYPNGSAYICVFEGKFKNFEKVNNYTYSMSVDYINTLHSIGSTWIEDDIRYIATEPYGFDGGTEFLLYTPKTPVSGLPEDFLMWIYRNADVSDTLNCYAIRNLANEQGFAGYNDLSHQGIYIAQHYIENVMTSAWLEPSYTVCDSDIHRFLVSLCNFKDTPHPMADIVTESEDGTLFLMDYSSVNTMVRLSFDRGFWAASQYADDLLDSEREFYCVPIGIGLPTSPFAYENIKSVFDGEFITVTFTLVNSKLYEFEEANYGNFKFVFDTNFKLVEFTKI